ncbi:hypothetical protein Patl1_09076 [Pistacia atlantica]|uniref:Uncharacterized protein n=1 Tax=Pistacia atlantica TaxID=434234 RepID=A0ACC1AL92_9ROSI|nr:hypothetical protein Patl1_09076 [Pistacia atlantica]
MFNNSGISISISDEESDDLGRMRVRVRRKRKKNNLRVKSEFTRRLLRFFLSHVEVKKSSLGEHLTRIEPPTRDVRDGRDRCLKLLPPDQLEHLDLPVNEKSRSHVKKVVYFSENDILDLGGNNTLSRQQSKGTRFNLFTGNQTFDEREKSFKVDKTAEVHCGFYSENGGFRVSDEDKRYMQIAKLWCLLVHLGEEMLFINQLECQKHHLRRYAMLHFGMKLPWQLRNQRGIKLVMIDLLGNGALWLWGNFHLQTRAIISFMDSCHVCCHQMLAHRLFPHSKYSIWVDSKSQFRKDPLGVLEALLWRSNSVLAISQHGARGSVYDEAKAVVSKHKATPEEVEVQLAQYRHDGLPEDKRFNGKKALSEASVIVREHTPLTNLFTCIWFNEVVRFTSRDQLSFPYVLWRLNVSENINMFPVCIRKDLVNAMGHIRKAKPLNSRMSMF